MATFEKARSRKIPLLEDSEEYTGHTHPVVQFKQVACGLGWGASDKRRELVRSKGLVSLGMATRTSFREIKWAA